MLIKEFLLISRDKHALLALFIMPAVFILIMSLALKDVFDEDKVLIQYQVIDQDKSKQSAFIIKKLEENKSMKRVLNANKDEVQFVLHVPKGFQEQFNTRSKTVKPMIIDVSSTLEQGRVEIFKTQVLRSLMQMRFELIQERFIKGVKAKKAKALMEVNEKDMLRLNYPSLSENQRPSSTQHSVPSWIVFALFFVIIPMSTIFINEKKQNTLERLRSMNVSILALFGGKMLPYMLINQVQVWVMIGVGMYIVPLFGASALSIEGSVLALVLLSFAISLSAICLSLLIAVLVDSVEQATTIGGLINILLGAIGGIMVPKFVMPAFMQEFSNISPMSWGLEGFLDIFLRQGTVMDVMNEILALLLFAFVLLGLAIGSYNYKLRRKQ